MAPNEKIDNKLTKKKESNREPRFLHEISRGTRFLDTCHK